MAFDIYAAVTDRIIAELEQGIIPWLKPWTGTAHGAISHTTGKPYSLLNQFLLGRDGEYITFAQAQKEGGKVKKGAKSKMVVFWKFLVKEKKDEHGHVMRDKDGNIIAERIPMLRYYNVFHVDDCENIAPKYADTGARTYDGEPIENAERVLMDYVNREQIKLVFETSDEAYYSPSRDMIHLPEREQFTSAAEFYGTAFHEATHSTGHKSRLNRLATGAAAAFGGEDYSKEELVAEIGSAAILNRLNIETAATFKNSAAYIQSWLRALKNDKRLIVSAAGKAEKAMNYILGENIENADAASAEA